MTASLTLGLRRGWKTASLRATGTLGEGAYFLADYLLRFLRVAALLAIWRTILDAGTPTGGMSLDAVLSYTLVSAIFGDQLQVRTNLDMAIWDGSIARRFLQPSPLAAQVVADLLGSWAFGLAFFSLPLILAAPLLGVDVRPSSGVAVPLFALSLALGVTIGVALDWVFAALLVRFNWWLWDVQRLRQALESLLSGAVVPLALLPWGLGGIIAWLPFASVASAPLRIYTGATDASWLLLLQALWAAALWPIAYRLWNANRERMISYGG